MVTRVSPFHCSTVPETKFNPVTVSVNAGSPTVALVWLRLVMTGWRLLMVNVAGGDVALPGAGLKTVIATVPASKTFAAGIVAVNCVAETNDVGRFVAFH